MGTSMPIDFFEAIMDDANIDPTGGYAEFVEPLAIILHSFDPDAIATGVRWTDDSQHKQGAYRFMAEAVLHGIGPSIERRAEARFTDLRDHQ